MRDTLRLNNDYKWYQRIEREQAVFVCSLLVSFHGIRMDRQVYECTVLV
jgi:hypothetical protein